VFKITKAKIELKQKKNVEYVAIDEAIRKKILGVSQTNPEIKINK
jgi:hypothetical protein